MVITFVSSIQNTEKVKNPTRSCFRTLIDGNGLIDFTTSNEILSFYFFIRNCRRTTSNNSFYNSDSNVAYLVSSIVEFIFGDNGIYPIVSSMSFNDARRQNERRRRKIALAQQNRKKRYKLISFEPKDHSVECNIFR